MNVDFKSFVETNPKLVTRKESKRYPGLFVLKYARKVFYDALWNTSQHLLECRGLVLDADYQVVVRPFTKIFNYQENGQGLDWDESDKVLVTKKINGFMAALTNYKGQLIISTTGSLDSDFVGYAHEYLKDIPATALKPLHTYMFEIVHPSDPHIIPEKIGAHFLAVVEHDSGLHHYKFDSSNVMDNAKIDFPKYGIHVEEEEKIVWVFGELKKHIKTIEHEGYVIVNPLMPDEKGTLKIKSPYYLFKKFLARVGVKRFVDGVRTGTIKSRIDEEYFPVIDAVVKYGVENFSALEEQQRLELLRSYMVYKEIA